MTAKKCLLTRVSVFRRTAPRFHLTRTWDHLGFTGFSAFVIRRMVFRKLSSTNPSLLTPAWH
jgi:hypothetical protein